MSSKDTRGLTVVITDCDHDTVDPELKVLGEAGLEVRMSACRTEEDVIAEARDADGLIVQYAPITERVLTSLPRCRVVARYGVGVDTVDVPAATRHGVWVANVPDYGVEEVSDHALTLILDLLRQVTRLDRLVRSGQWDALAVRPLHRIRGLTLGVVGTGRIGCALARKALALGLRVIACDVLGVPEELRETGAREVTFEELLERSDVISLHVPLEESTRHLISAEELRRMKPSAYLVNTARGGLVDTDALLEALDTGEIAGAALDVLEMEPPEAGSRLLTHERVVLTPHAAWYSEESYDTLKAEAAREVVRVLSGGRPRSPVNEPEERRADD